MRNFYSRSNALMLLLLFTIFYNARAQAPVFNWSETGQFGVFAGGSISADYTVQVKGSAGSVNSIDYNVQATGQFLDQGQGNVWQAYYELQNNMSQGWAYGGNWIDPNLSGQVLTEGVYNTDNAYLYPGTSLELQGDSTSVFLFNISNGLTLDDFSNINIGAVKPENIFWNVDGHIEIRDHATAYGAFMSNQYIYKTGTNFGEASLLALGDVYIMNNPTPWIGHNRFYSRGEMKFTSIYAQFGLLAPNIIVDQIAVKGSVGLDNSMNPNIISDNTITTPSSELTNALAGIGALYNENWNQSSYAGQISNNLSGVHLSEGVYSISGNATLSSGTQLTLEGDANSIFTFLINGNLNVETYSSINIGSIRPENIYWNVTGNIDIQEFATTNGIFISNYNITKDGFNMGRSSLFALNGPITITNGGVGAGDPYYSPQAMKTGPGAALTQICLPPPALNTANPNLIINGSFETRPLVGQTPVCPTGLGGIEHSPTTTACSWFSPEFTPGFSASPDHFCNCAPGNNGVSVPNNFFGTNRPAHTFGGPAGTAYTGIYAGDTSPLISTYREYLQQTLPSGPGSDRVLKKDRDYYGEFFVSCASGSPFGTTNLAMYVTPTSPATSANATFLKEVNPSISTKIQYTGTPIVSTAWTQVSGTFKAKGGENIITIGNFVYNATRNSSNWASTGRSGAINNSAYYFIDDVALFEIPYAGDNKTICKGSSITLGSNIELPTRLNPTYAWTTDRDMINTPPFSTALNPVVTPTDGPITYYLKVSINGSVVSTSSVTINVAGFTPPVSQNICQGTPMTLVAGPGMNSYEWTAGTSHWYGSSITVNPSATTTYTVTGTSYLPSGTCSFSYPVTLTVTPNVSATVTGLPLTPTSYNGGSVLNFTVGSIQNGTFESVTTNGGAGTITTPNGPPSSNGGSFRYTAPYFQYDTNVDITVSVRNNCNQIVSRTFTFTIRGSYIGGGRISKPDSTTTSQINGADLQINNPETASSDLHDNMSKAFIIYPNPSSGSFTIAGSGSSYRLFNSQGAEVKTGALNGERTLVNAENLAKGLYFLYIQNGKEVEKQQIVIE